MALKNYRITRTIDVTFEVDDSLNEMETTALANAIYIILDQGKPVHRLYLPEGETEWMETEPEGRNYKTWKPNSDVEMNDIAWDTEDLDAM